MIRTRAGRILARRRGSGPPVAQHMHERGLYATGGALGRRGTLPNLRFAPNQRFRKVIEAVPEIRNQKIARRLARSGFDRTRSRAFAVAIGLYVVVWLRFLRPNQNLFASIATTIALRRAVQASFSCQSPATTGEVTSRRRQTYCAFFNRSIGPTSGRGR
jgi:hypothetical protein